MLVIFSPERPVTLIDAGLPPTKIHNIRNTHLPTATQVLENKDVDELIRNSFRFSVLRITTQRHTAFLILHSAFSFLPLPTALLPLLTRRRRVRPADPKPY